MTTDMRIEGWGFAREFREATPLESKLGIHISRKHSLPGNPDKNTFYEFSVSPQGSVTGVYRGTTDEGVHIIQPSLLPSGDKGRVWSSEATFLLMPIIGFRPVTRSYLESLGEGFAEVHHLGTYMDDFTLRGKAQQDSQQQ